VLPIGWAAVARSRQSVRVPLLCPDAGEDRDTAAPHAEQVLALLTEAPPRIAAMTAGVSPGQVRASPQPGEWSANEVLAHLRACADVWGSCISTILAEDHPTIRAVNPRTWIEQTDYVDLQFEPSLQAFAAQRAELVAVLEPLEPRDWSRSATITGAGRPLERTVLFYATWLTRHEQTHLKQIQAAMRTVSNI
jgi:hypothetical protein